MSEDRRSPVEQLRGIVDRLPQMDYYQVLGAAQGDDERTIKRRFYDRSRRYHPDRFHHVTDADFRALIQVIYKLVAEAYNVLKEPRLRRRYDVLLAQDRTANLRYSAEADAKAQKEYDGGTGPGSRFYKLAAQAVATGNAAAAQTNIKLALSMEPQNPHFLTLKARIDQL